MTTLMVGASGATGRLLVEQLLKRGQLVKVVVRSLDNLTQLFSEQRHSLYYSRKPFRPERR